MLKLEAIVFLVSLLASPAVLACGGCAEPAKADPPAAAAASQTATLKIEGMTCAACSVTVRTAAKKLDGVLTIDVDVKAGSATVTFDGAKVTAEQIAVKITESGYKATVQPEKGA